MRFIRYDVLALGLSVCLGIQIAEAQDEQTAETAGGGLVRSQLTLAQRPVTVAFAPTLDVDDPAYRQLLSARGPASAARVRVGELEGGPLLRVGTLDGSTPADAGADDAPRPPSTTYDLWLTRTGEDWALEVHAAAIDETAARPDVAGSIPLSREPAGEAFGSFSAAVVPTADDAGQLVLRWGNQKWTADFQFADPPEREAADEESEPPNENPGDVREFDTDTRVIARASRLAERHEAAIVLPDGARISVLFWKELSVEHEDFALIPSVADGEVVRLTEAAITRLRTEVPLQFGRVTIPTGNLAQGFPGAYGLWLKRVGRGWRLVFNHEADSWGTQHDPEFDAAEIELAYSQGSLSTRPLGVALVPATARSGQLVIHWGAHEWRADFTIPQ